jgi:hypothetical protein
VKSSARSRLRSAPTRKSVAGARTEWSNGITPASDGCSYASESEKRRPIDGVVGVGDVDAHHHKGLVVLEEQPRAVDKR